IFTSDLRQVLNGTDLVNAPLDPTQAVYEGSSPMADRFGVDQHMRTPYMQNFNLNLQQQIGSRLVFQIGYVGSNGHKLFRFRDLNQPSLSDIQQTDYAVLSGFDPNSTTNGDVSGCYCADGKFTSAGTYWNYQEASANSSYNSLQTSLRV